MPSLFDALSMSVFLALLLYVSSIYRSLSLEEECTIVEYDEKYEDPEKSDCDPKSGWHCDYKPEFSHRNGDHAFCDLETIQLDADMDTFFEKCYFKRGCLINTTIDDWTNSTFWMKDNFLSEYGDYQFDAGGSLEIVLKAGIGKEKYTLKEYVDLVFEHQNDYRSGEPMYIFDRTIWDEEDRKFKDNHFQKENVSFYMHGARRLRYNGQILALGSTGTGATFHAHGESWLFLVSGRKRWFLYPPNLEPVGGFWPGYSSKDWFEYIYPHLHREYDYELFDVMADYNLSFENDEKGNRPRSNIFYRDIDGQERVELDERDHIFLTDFSELNDAKPLECIQSPGQIMYLPEFWWHSVLNLGNVVIGGAIQTSHARTHWMRERNIHDGVRRILNGGNTEKQQWTDLEIAARRMHGIKAFERLSHSGPISAVHQFFMGFEYWDSGPAFYDDAIVHLTEAILMDPTFIEAYSYLSRVYSLKTPNNKHYDLEKAEDLLRIAYLLNPNNEGVRSKLKLVFKRSDQHYLMKLVDQRKPLPPRVSKHQ